MDDPHQPTPGAERTRRFPSSTLSGGPVPARADTGPPGRVRRTYYFSRAVADELEAAAAAVHEASHGTVPKHQAYQAYDEIAARHQA